ncbi:MAG: hypothetical protein SGARI_002890 [Bacillariaceae sp.]
MNNPSFERERDAIFANRTNSDFKWQRSKQVVGALEVKSELEFKPRADLVPRYKENTEDTFEEALQAWEDVKLRQSFIATCEEFEVESCCCGLMHDPDASIKEYVKLLNDKWVKEANKKLQSRGVKIDMFLWNWQNASGKAETNIMLIRFFQLSLHKFRRASNEGSLDLDDIIPEEDEGAKDGDQSKKSNTVIEDVDDVGAGATIKAQEMAR